MFFVYLQWRYVEYVRTVLEIIQWGVKQLDDSKKKEVQSIKDGMLDEFYGRFIFPNKIETNQKYMTRAEIFLEVKGA